MKVNTVWNTPLSAASLIRRRKVGLEAIESRAAALLGVSVGEYSADPVGHAKSAGASVYLGEDHIYVTFEGSPVSVVHYFHQGVDFAVRKAVADAVIMRFGSPRLLDIDLEDLL